MNIEKRKSNVERGESKIVNRRTRQYEACRSEGGMGTTEHLDDVGQGSGGLGSQHGLGGFDLLLIGRDFDLRRLGLVDEPFHPCSLQLLP